MIPFANLMFMYEWINIFFAKDDNEKNWNVTGTVSLIFFKFYKLLKIEMISEIRWIKILRGKEIKNMVKISYLFFCIF